MTDAERDKYAEDTRRVACVALGEAAAARLLTSSLFSFLVNDIRVMPRNVAVELLDLWLLRMEEMRPNMPSGSADWARRLLSELMEHIGREPSP